MHLEAKAKVFEAKAPAKGVQVQGFLRPRPEISVPEVSQRLRTVLEDPIPG